MHCVHSFLTQSMIWCIACIISSLVLHKGTPWSYYSSQLPKQSHTTISLSLHTYLCLQLTHSQHLKPNCHFLQMYSSFPSIRSSSFAFSTSSSPLLLLVLLLFLLLLFLFFLLFGKTDGRMNKLIISGLIQIRIDRRTDGWTDRRFFSSHLKMNG